MSIEHVEIIRHVGTTYTQLFTTTVRLNGDTVKDMEITVYHADKGFGRPTAEINASSFNGSVERARQYMELYQAAIEEAVRLDGAK